MAACGAMVFAAVITAGTGGAVADPTTDRRGGQTSAQQQRDLSTSALQGVLHTADPTLVGTSVREAHRTLTDRATRAPGAQGSASVVFDAGRTSGELAGFVADHGVELYAVEVKVPAAGQVHTMWFNDVARVGGSTAEKVDRLTGSARLRYFQQAESAPAARRSGLRELAEGDYRVYRAEVVGTNSRLAALVGSSGVRAVLPDSGDAKVTDLREAKAEAKAVESAVPATEVRLETGVSAPTRQGERVITNTGQSCSWKSSGVLACSPGERRAVSGEAAVDNALPRTADSMVAGSTGSSPSQGRAARDDSSVWTGCNNAADNQACPNDHTYRPHPDTGGYQDFGVSIANYAANTVIYLCYAEWVPDPWSEGGTEGYWQVYCYPYAVVTSAFTYGAAQWDSRWGTQQTTIAAAQTSRPISTLGYKFVDGLQPCVVQQFLATAECSRALPNSVWVPRTGMEDELLMGNPACSPTPILGRSGTAEDRNKGCFYPSYAASTLPAPFLDTTFGDGQAYNLAIGSSSPASLVEGRTYSSYAEFWAYGNNNMIGQTAHHSVAVDSRVTEAAICVAQGNVDPFCYFPVDSSRVSPIRPFV
ncbi:hypothetical protein BU204_17640 [Actinophytocola xanthii]|uniref:Uncharacterized protein n=1 Tax=Actinophytocola xanthii TaxID=1912961 RepID=A0A1Q8CPC3_9PSEU|nr:hypothetical protein BU204_17640 [Actinophytocola xanthii]